MHVPPIPQLILSPYDVSSISAKADSANSYITPTSRLSQTLSRCTWNNNTSKANTFLFVSEMQNSHSQTHAIISLLQSHPKMFVGGFQNRHHGIYHTNASLVVDVVRSLFARATNHTSRAFGYVLSSSQIIAHYEEWATIVEQFNTRLIWVYRSNLVRQAVEEYSRDHFNKDELVDAAVRMTAKRRKGCESEIDCSFEIDNLELFGHMLRERLEWDGQIAHSVQLVKKRVANLCAYAVRYEEYRYNRRQVIKELNKFVGLSYIGGDRDAKVTRYERDYAICEMVSNWDDVCEKLYQMNVWRHMFDDIRNGCFCHYAFGTRALV